MYLNVRPARASQVKSRRRRVHAWRVTASRRRPPQPRVTAALRTQRLGAAALSVLLLSMPSTHLAFHHQYGVGALLQWGAREFGGR